MKLINIIREPSVIIILFKLNCMHFSYIHLITKMQEKIAICVTGIAGVGKSYISHELSKYIEKKNYRSYFM